MDLTSILATLSAKRPIFHSEADFQFALAWEIQQVYPSADIRLEYPYMMGAKEYIDILVRLDGRVYPIELKYKTKLLDCTYNAERFSLKNQGAGDFGSYDFIKDICRLERFSSIIDGFKTGYAIWLTNDSYYLNPPRKDDTGAAEFRVYNGSKKYGKLAWGEAMKNTKGREVPLTLNNEYEIRWQVYSKLQDVPTGEFKYSLNIVEA